MKRLASLAFAAFLAASCQDGGGEPPPPQCGENEELAGDGCVCVEGYERDEADVCVEVEEPPPPTAELVPSDYIRRERVDGILNYKNVENPGLVAEAQFMTSAGWRDPLNVAAQCGEDVAAYLGVTKEWLVAFGEEGMELQQGKGGMESRWLPRWTEIHAQVEAGEGKNRRCGKEPDPPTGPTWCQVTDVRKEFWGEFYDGYSPKGFPGRYKPHLKAASELRARAGRCSATLLAATGEAFDSIAGFCQKLIKTGFNVEDCPK